MCGVRKAASVGKTLEWWARRWVNEQADVANTVKTGTRIDDNTSRIIHRINGNEIRELKNATQ